MQHVDRKTFQHTHTHTHIHIQVIVRDFSYLKFKRHMLFIFNVYHNEPNKVFYICANHFS
jgi:hypothetical protein